MDKRQFENELLFLAKEEVRKRGFVFSSSTELQLQELISSGVNRMETTNRTDRGDLELARRHMRKLSMKLCEMEESHSRLVEQRTFTSARFTICPLWPFC